MRTLCQEVVVKFRQNSHGHNNLRITLGDAGTTAAHRIAAVDSGDRLVLTFLDKENRPRKVLCFPMDVVQEYSLENIENPPTPVPTPTPTAGSPGGGRHG